MVWLEGMLETWDSGLRLLLPATEPRKWLNGKQKDKTGEGGELRYCWLHKSVSYLLLSVAQAYQHHLGGVRNAGLSSL